MVSQTLQANEMTGGEDRSRNLEQHALAKALPQEAGGTGDMNKKACLRQTLARIVNNEDRSKIGTAVMIISTLNVFFALFGRDFQLAFFPKSTDTAFQIGFLISFALFLTEMIVTSIVDPNYKWSFFFWLDAVATFSLILDIPWILDAVYAFVAGSTSGPLAGIAEGSAGKAGKAGRTGARAGRVTRILRINRMIRVVKMSDVFTFYQKRRREAKEREGADEDPEHPTETPVVKKVNKVEASKISKTLSDSNTRKVVVSILLILIVQPLLTVEEVDKTPTAGLVPAFYYGSSRSSAPCTPTNDEFMCSKLSITNNHPEDGWLTPEGWQELLWTYRECYKGFHIDGSSFSMKLLSIELPDLKEGGKIRSVDKIKSLFGEWHQDKDCTSPDGSKADKCAYRDSEMETFSFTPEECTDEGNTSCPFISAEAIFENRTGKRLDALQQIFVTLLIVILLCLGSFLFSSFTHSMVIQPVEKMVNIIKQLAEEPLSRPQIAEEGENVDTKKGSHNKLETRMLENTLLKIGGLMQLGFGQAGADIISRNISSESGTLDLLVPGKRVYGVFGFASILHFQEVTDCLSEEVLVFVNKIARIVHYCVNEWRGAPNKNIGDTFFLVWIVPSSPPEPVNKTGSPRQTLLAAAREKEAEQMQKNLKELCDNALFASLKMMAEFRRASDLAAYAKHPKIIPRLGAGYSVNVSVGLHCGWAVQGVTGSKYKVDASYFSPHVNLAAHVQKAARRYYGVSVLFSETVYSNLCTQAQSRARQVDNVSLKAQLSPIKVFTFDIGKDELPPRGHDRQKIGKFFPPDENPDQRGNVDYMFMVDQDIVSMQRTVGVEFQAAWRQALENYLRGDWVRAEEFARKCLMIKPEDGPAIHILTQIKSKKGVLPDNWKGFTKLEYI